MTEEELILYMEEKRICYTSPASMHKLKFT